MTNKEPKKKYRSYIKWLIALFVIVVLLTGLRMALKSNWLLDYAREIAVEQANSQLNGKLEIGAIRGDLLFGITVSDIRLSDLQQNEIIAVDTLQLRYTLPSLIRAPHRLDLLRAEGVRGTLIQNEDSTWNAEHLLPDQPEEDPADPDPLYWSVDRLLVDNANISFRSDLLLPDGYLEIEDLSLQTMAEMFLDRWYVSLDHLNMKIREGRLPAPVEFSMKAVAEEEHITLETLVINTGRTLLQTEGDFINQQAVTGRLDLIPLSKEDMSAYLEEYPVQQDLKMGVTAEGTLNDLTLSVTVDAGAGGHLSVTAGTDVTDPYVLKNLSFELNRFNGTELLGDTTLPLIGYASLSGSGTVHVMEPERADWEGTLSAERMSLDGYLLDAADFTYSLSDGLASLNGSLQKNGDEIQIDVGASSVFGSRPEWRTAITTENLNLANWLPDPEMDSRLTISINAYGSGKDPDDLTSNLDVLISDGRFGDQEFASIRFNGNITPVELTGKFLAVIDESRFSADVFIEQWADHPNYIFTLGFEEVNLAEFAGLEEIPTFLNGKLTGEGRSFDLETLQLTAVAEFDSSIVNGDPIDSLRADLSILNQALIIENGILESTIADADFSLRQHMTDFKDSQNRLQFSAEIKDLYPIAQILGFDRLEAEGRAEGLLERNEEGVLEFNGDLEFENIFVDTVFNADKIVGNVAVRLLDDIEIESRFELSQPGAMGQNIQNFNFTATATLAEDETFGNVGFELINDEESRLIHAGRYSITSDQLQLTSNQIDFHTPFRVLSLRREFDITYKDDVLRVDTLRIESDDEEAYVELWASHIDSVSQNMGLDARELNLGVLQRTFIGEEMVEGYLSGFIQINNSPDSLSLRMNGNLSEIQYEEGEMDALRLAGEIENEWLELSLSATHDGGELFSSNLKVPFLPGDPGTFDDQFFDREIEGQFSLNPTDINYWLSFVPGNFAQQTEGTLSFEGLLTGQAGMPEFTGDLQFRDGRLSGVPIDLFGVNIVYEHNIQELEFNGDILSRGTEVLDFNSRVPFKIDLRELEILLPSEGDSIHADLETRNFNMAIFNDFVDRSQIRQISGRLNGTVNVSGTLANMEPEGRLVLTDGSLRVVQAGITLSNIESEVSFSSDQIRLLQFSMRSGPGRIRASGTVAIENLVPGNMDIQIRGNQFRAVNTTEYNAIVDLTSNITGTYQEPNLRGSLSFLSGYVNLQNFGERSVEDVALEGEEEQDPMAFYDSMDIEMDVNFRRQFFLRNRQFLDMEIELGGQVDLLKRRHDELEMFGQLEGVRGYARPLGRNFELEDAFVTFSGAVDNPELNVRTQFIPPQARADVIIYYIIEGTAQDPEFRFESEPQMELQDIISYTVFGRPFYELESWEQVVAGSGGGPSATDVALDVLLDRVEILASQRLGIDVVQIDNSRTGTNSNTSILTGWYLNRRTFFALINEISSTPKTLFLLEYLLTENLELIITQGDDSREGIDLRWKYDY